MKKELVINVCSQKVKNHFRICPSWTYNLVNDNLTKMIETESLDLCGLQEVTKPRNRNFQNKLKNGTLVEGKGRYLGMIPFVDEFNSLIVNNDKFKVVSSKTYHLPWMKDVKNQISSGALMSRIATLTTLETCYKEIICVIVTHIDYHSLQVQEE